ncbi:hypothetical protein SEH50133_03107 [Salmonella enterica subsp. houtenae serovar 50:g,z51:- str. 01-0133]|nr:hypothetical protein [Salmonella enterica]EHY68089.1 hypothetical protein SEHO0A_03842 [Salmonella enterica subsp. houtenae str. ATCC BAA-1581]ESE91736.1 hypothetical protein SEH50133_03107 [Salmonella enterica subsp. houtenae serovar 50:g,z51:- str. 01-0133]OSE74327.1 hypothetical protein R591_13545 [Salmonella enterica subsp. houtenae serovar 40:z4,z32:-]
MTTEKFSSAQKCVSDHIFLTGLKTKNLAEKKRGFCSEMRVVAAKHTVLCQQQKYTRSVQNAQFRREF